VGCRATSTDPLARRVPLQARREAEEGGARDLRGDRLVRAHHDVCVLDDQGTVLAKGKVSDDVSGVGRLHAMLAEHVEDSSEVVVGIETDRGLLVGSLVQAGYHVYAINPLAASRYRDRHAVSRAKSDPADAKVLADLVRTDRQNHREVAGDTELAEAVKVLARAHQNLIWSRQRQVNALRNTLREFYPGALRAFSTSQLATIEACSVLVMAPTPTWARDKLTLQRLRRSLAASGRKRNLDRRAGQILQALQAPELSVPPLLEQAYGEVVGSLVVVIDGLTHQIMGLEAELSERFEGHPDAEIITSLPGLSSVLGARVLAEFGDDPTRYVDARARRRYAGTAPITVPRGPDSSCWRASQGTGGCSMPATGGRSPPSTPPPEPAATTTPTAAGARPTTRRSAPSPTAGSGSCTDA
jgi:transposase